MLTRTLRGLGWVLIATGVVVGLYVVYLLFYTNVTTERAQQELRDAWEGIQAEAEAAEAVDEEADPGEVRDAISVGDAYAVIWFERPGSDEPIVRDGPTYVVSGVSLDVLRRGPGHYPESAAPGEDGNLAIAGHRTTHGAPFYNLDELELGDEIHVVDRSGRHWRYIVRETMIVAPTDVWVVGDDPLGDGYPLLTLTTCHPRFSAAQRYVVFAGLDGEVTS